MLKAVNVYLWGGQIGTVSLVEGDPIARFQYTPEALRQGIEISPCRMPLRPISYAFPELSIQSFRKCRRPLANGPSSLHRRKFARRSRTKSPVA